MVSRCANPLCGKPLHYLRDGRVYLFSASKEDGTRTHPIRHYWLCGACSASMILLQDGDGVRTWPKIPSFNDPLDREEPSPGLPADSAGL